MTEAPSAVVPAAVPYGEPDGTLAAAKPPSGGGAARSGPKRQGVLGFLSGDNQGNSADDEGYINWRKTRQKTN